jgi:hypothetical protein
VINALVFKEFCSISSTNCDHWFGSLQQYFNP